MKFVTDTNNNNNNDNNNNGGFFFSVGQYFLSFLSFHSSIFLIYSEASAYLEWRTFCTCKYINTPGVIDLNI